MINPARPHSMRRTWSMAIAIAMTAMAISVASGPAQAGNARVWEDFATGSARCLPEPFVLAPWTVTWTGDGCVRWVRSGRITALRLSPRSALTASDTHSALVTGPRMTVPFSLIERLRTVRQLRTGSTPNAWEVGWVVWNWRDRRHFCYFIPKPDGWELGKRDPAYPGGQRFLATGTSPTFPIGHWYDVRIVQRPGDEITVTVDGRRIVRMTDTERPYRRGRIALYSEDARVDVDRVAARPWGH